MVNFITEKYLRRYPTSKKTKSWEGSTVHIRTEHGIWRKDGYGYTNNLVEAWKLSFEEARDITKDLGPEKKASYIRA